MNKMNMNKELVFLRAFAVAMAIGVIFITTSAMKKMGNQKFTEIDVERINIVEKDGTVKLIITNVDRFPTSGDMVNGNEAHGTRGKWPGMLFFNDEGLECGGIIYRGKKTEYGHDAGMSLTYDQFDGDQVMQLITTDSKVDGKRTVGSRLILSDRSENESQAKMLEASKVLEELRSKDPQAYKEKLNEYLREDLFKSIPRVALGKIRDFGGDGLFLFDDKGTPRAMFYVDKENNAKLDFFDEKGNIIASFPEK